MTAPAPSPAAPPPTQPGPAWLARFVAPPPGTPVYLETADPSAVRRVVEATSAAPPTGAATPVVVVSPEAELAKWSGPVPGRVVFFTGKDAGEALSTWLAARMDLLLSGVHLTEPGLSRRADHDGRVGVEAIVHAALESQRSTLGEMHAANIARYAPRTRTWWAQRFREAASGGPALRVLIITTRFSTFVRHSGEDLAAALRAQSCDVRVLIEPDGHSTLTTVAYARAIHQHQPDLVVCINYARVHLGPALEVPVPMACWIQDELRHLFDPRVGRAGGPLDYVVGHTHDALFTRCGYDPGRALCVPVPVSSQKFHPGAISPEQRERFACEIAYVGHQSEPPGALRDRLIASARGAGPGNAIPAVIEAVYPDVERLAGEALGEPVLPRLEAALARAIRAVTGREPDALSLTSLMGSVVKPLGDRVIRHQMLNWAAQIATRRGWRLKLFGRGWSATPGLGRFAAGEVEHGEDLRACYQAAGVHLHASISTNMHQRVVECVLAGGLPLVRLKREDLAPGWLLAELEALRSGEAEAQYLANRHVWYSAIDQPDALRALCLQQRLGLGGGNGFSFPLRQRSPSESAGSLAMQRDVVWLMGDLAQTGFSDAAGLEAALARAIESPPWRESTRGGIARRARALSFDTVAQRLLTFITDRLAGG